MAYKTFGELSSQVQRELDIEAEEFIQPAELIEYFNSAIRQVEAHLMKIGLREKYLEGDTLISTVLNQADYDLPADCVDGKVKKVIYRNGSVKYKVPLERGEDMYLEEEILNEYSANETYRYRIAKDATTKEYKLRLVPKASATVANCLRVYFERDLNRYDDDDTDCDVPDICYEYILSYVRWRCYAKETHVNTPIEGQQLLDLKQLMSETLVGQVSDTDQDKIDQDLTVYEEMS